MRYLLIVALVMEIALPVLANDCDIPLDNACYIDFVSIEREKDERFRHIIKFEIYNKTDCAFRGAYIKCVVKDSDGNAVDTARWSIKSIPPNRSSEYSSTIFLLYEFDPDELEVELEFADGY